ncbi:DUF6221 family protein [Streptomyces sp. NPDC085944]|uniref:DUF6221 family protein n=1 Tax=Streptomyces sp. NPDC085944 TaxID=3154962 RepID=UPI00341515A0
MDDLVHWLRAQLDDDERIARAASGATVVGEPGAWEAAPLGDEWEVSSGEDEELLVALRPGLPRPPDVMSGLWGAVVSHRQDEADPDADSPTHAFEHAARHDPARVLREINAKRQLFAIHRSEPNPDWDRPGVDGRSCTCCITQYPCPTLRLFALPYADRPGYREHWRP